MSKAFVRENDAAQEAVSVPEPQAAPAPGRRNYITPGGYARLKAELRELVERERPEVVRTVSWAASNGDRSENGDYIYGKKRLREIDRRVRFLIKRLEAAEVVDNAGRDSDQVFFGATVVVRSESGGERRLTIVGPTPASETEPRASTASTGSTISVTGPTTSARMCRPVAPRSKFATASQRHSMIPWATTTSP